VTGIVGHVVDAGMAKVAENIGTVKSRHSDFGTEHLEEGGEGREDTTKECCNTI